MDKKILDALIVLQEECKKHDDCSKCQLYAGEGEGCYVVEGGLYPEGWNLTRGEQHGRGKEKADK